MREIESRRMVRGIVFFCSVLMVMRVMYRPFLRLVEEAASVRSSFCTCAGLWGGREVRLAFCIEWVCVCISIEIMFQIFYFFQNFLAIFSQFFFSFLCIFSFLKLLALPPFPPCHSFHPTIWWCLLNGKIVSGIGETPVKGALAAGGGIGGWWCRTRLP